MQIVSYIIIQIIQEYQNNEFEESIKKLEDKNEKLKNQKSNFDKILKNYQIKLDEKEKEIMKLKETNIFLNKKIKSLETKKNINNSIESKSESKSLNNHTMNDISDILKIGSDKYLIGNSKKNYKLISNNHSAINNNINHKKLLINKNITLSTINSIKEEKPCEKVECEKKCETVPECKCPCEIKEKNIIK